MTSVHMTDQDGALIVSAPFHPDWPAAARALGGRWDPSRKVWTFDSRDRERVRTLLRRIYGVTGDADSSASDLIVRLRQDKLPKAAFPEDNRLMIAGRIIAQRFGRDTPVRLGPDVVVVHGGFEERAGSRARPQLGHLPGTVLEFRHAPPELLDLSWPGIEAVSAADEHIAALRARVHALRAELAEAERALAEAEAASGTTAAVSDRSEDRPATP